VDLDKAKGMVCQIVLYSEGKKKMRYEGITFNLELIKGKTSLDIETFAAGVKADNPSANIFLEYRGERFLYLG
jgi:hypothetical protein